MSPTKYLLKGGGRGNSWCIYISVGVMENTNKLDEKELGLARGKRGCRRGMAKQAGGSGGGGEWASERVEVGKKKGGFLIGGKVEL